MITSKKIYSIQCNILLQSVIGCFCFVFLGKCSYLHLSEVMTQHAHLEHLLESSLQERQIQGAQGGGGV